MAMSDYEKSKFKFSETFNNSTGKTSGSGFIGVLMGLTAILGFICGTVAVYLKSVDGIQLVDASLQLGMLSAILMGVRKASGIFGNGRKTEIEKDPQK